MILELLRWWYGTGWAQAARRTASWTQEMLRWFSVDALLRTLFEPWRRIVNAGARSLDQKVHAALDNLVSRCVGFTVRLFVLAAAGLLALGAGITAASLTVVWPLMPLAFLYCIIRGILG